ncbi:ATP-binding protein [Streptomyces globisporus]|uniref:ATP-binding protein n=1 Tax=Streptomyces globisporus TaxID=1908 RepID=UPI003791678C
MSLAQGHASTRCARSACRQALERWCVYGDAADSIVLMVHELVANALEHGSSPVTLRLRLTHTRSLICEVDDASTALPVARPPNALAEGGRGLLLVEALSEAWGACVTPTGKMVWFRSRIA